MQRQALQQRALAHSGCQHPGQTLLYPAGRRPRQQGLVCVARRTVSGGSETKTTKGSPLKRPDSINGTSKSRSSKTAPATLKPPTPAPQHSRSSSSSNSGNSSSSSSRGQPGTQRGAKVNKPSQLEEFMRSTPGFNRFLDGTLILGDAVMVLATELSSERIPLEVVPALGGVAVTSWVLAGAILGDYTTEPDPDANPLSDAMGWPIFAAVVNSMITWAVCMVLSIFGFSWLVSNFIVEPEMVLEVARDGMLSPQLEISVALLITMSCWRGMAARLRL